jgi:hypothetical protein
VRVVCPGGVVVLVCGPEGGLAPRTLQLPGDHTRVRRGSVPTFLSVAAYVPSVMLSPISGVSTVVSPPALYQRPPACAAAAACGSSPLRRIAAGGALRSGAPLHCTSEPNCRTAHANPT